MKRVYIFAVALVVFTYLPVSATIINIPDDYSTIQQGINASTDGDTVLVQPGTYWENINFNGHNIVLGSLFLTTGDTTYIEETVIDGDSSGSVVTFESGEDSTTVICGMTIQNGYAYKGGGIYANLSSPVIANNIIRANTADSVEHWAKGGGIYCNGSNSIITSNLIVDNFSESMGGGIYCSNSNIVIAQNTIVDNLCSNDGGAVNLYNCDNTTLSDNIIARNKGQAGGIYCLRSDPIITGNSINDNEVYAYGGPIPGALACIFSDPTIINNEFRGNQFVGIYCDSSSPVIIENLIIENRKRF